MPRVLLVTYPWLPAFNAGVRHAAVLARHLPEAGWDPIVLARDWGDPTVAADDALRLSFDGAEELPAMRAARALPTVLTPWAPRENRFTRWKGALESPSPDGGAHRARSVAHAVLEAAWPLYGAYPDGFRGWVAPAVQAGVAAIRQFGIGAVVSLSAPDSAHIAGGEIARAAGVPWIPLFGELGSFRLGEGDGRTMWERLEHRELARRWLRGAFGAGAVSPEMRDHLERHFSLSVETLVIPFDPEERRVPPRRVAGAPLRLVHVGRLGGAEQVVPLVQALDLLLAADASVAARLVVEVVGSDCDDALLALFAGHPAAALVRMRERVRPAEAVILQREADALLLFDAGDPLARYPATLFEQVNSRRPTIAFAAEESFVARVLRETRAGASAGEVAGLAALIAGALDALAERGEVPFAGDDAAIARYGGPEQARRIAAMLDVASADRFGRWQRG